MRRSFALLHSLLLLVALPSAAVLAQEEPAPLRIEAVNVSGYPDVRFSFGVSGASERQLTAGDVTVTENGVTQPADVDLASSADLQIILLIDTTGSMGGPPLAGAQQAAASFLSDLPEDAGVAIMGFDVETTVISDFGASREEQLAGIDGLAADGSTGMYDAVRDAAALFPDGTADTRRVIVLLADGEDNASDIGVDDAIGDLTDGDITLSSIEYLTNSAEGQAIRSMAAATGGAVLEAADAEALTAVYQELAADLVSQYAVSYVSEGNGSVELTVTVDDGDQVATGSRTIALPPAEVVPAPEAEEEPDEAAVTPGPPVVPPVESQASGRLWLAIGAGLWFVALALLLLVFFAPRRRRSQLAGAAAGLSLRARGVSDLANRATAFADRKLERRGYRGRLNAALERAGIDLRPGEFLVLVASAAITAAAVGRLLNGWLMAIALAISTVIAARLVVTFKTDRRQKRFADQLGETLQLLSGSLRAGYSLMQAVDAVAREADSPAAEEFGRLVVETRLGRDMDDALRAMSDRMQSEDFSWVMQAIEIHREVGGDLAEVLDTVAGTIRERNQIRRQVQALSAEGRLSAYVLIALPFGVGGMILLTNPSYLGELTNGGLLGWGLIGLGAFLMLVGIIWMRKLVRLVF